MLRLLLSISPAAVVLVVAWAVLGGGSEQVRYVQVLGGPTREGSELSVLIRALHTTAERSTPLAELGLIARLRSGSENAQFEGRTDSSGLVEARFALAAPPRTELWLEIEELGTLRRLAAGPLALSADAWRAGARRNGGWAAGNLGGALEVSVAPESGIFAVPFAGRLLIRTRLANGPGGPVPVAGAVVGLELDGAELVAPGLLPPTDAHGITVAELRPLEHAVSVRIVARDGSRQGLWYGALPIVPGAFTASLDADGLMVRSPVVRERAYLSLVTQRERITGAIVPLTPEPDGTASGWLEIAPPLRARTSAEPAWAVVSSELDKRSPGVVGWPLGTTAANEPRLTFDVADRLLLDGRDGALRDVLQERNSRRRVAALALLAVGLALSIAFWFEVRGRQRRVSGADATAELPALAPSGWVLGVAIACILLGLGALSLFALVGH